MVSVHRVHGPGSSEQMTIVMESDRICGSGRFSNVYRAVLKSPEARLVAVKNVWEETNNLPIVGLHPEIQILSQLDHPNVVRLLYHYTKMIDKQKVHCLVLDYQPDDMAKLRDRGVRFDLLDATLYSYQLLLAVAYLDTKKIVHLDIKPANLLVDHLAGILQLGDFGNARKADQEVPEEQTYQVTRYYRAPEVVFGTKFFTSAIDTWAAGCCMAEFILGRVLFKGKSAAEQMKLLVGVFGYPTDEDVKAMLVSRPRTSRPTPKGFDKYSGGDLPPDAVEILQRVFVYNPKKRMSAAECVKIKFFDRLKTKPTRSTGGQLPPLLGMATKEEDGDSEEDD